MPLTQALYLNSRLVNAPGPTGDLKGSCSHRKRRASAACGSTHRCCSMIGGFPPSTSGVFIWMGCRKIRSCAPRSSQPGMASNDHFAIPESNSASRMPFAMTARAVSASLSLLSVTMSIVRGVSPRSMPSAIVGIDRCSENGERGESCAAPRWPRSGGMSRPAAVVSHRWLTWKSSICPITSWSIRYLPRLWSHRLMTCSA